MATQALTIYSQCRTFNHVYLFKSKSDQSLTLKIFDQAQKKLIKITAPAANLLAWSKIENAKTLLSLFIQQSLIPPDFIPSAPVIDPIHELQQLIVHAKSKVSVETDNMKKFICPITLEVFEDPVIDEHGHTFERSTIEHARQRNNNQCPISREPIASLTPNRGIKDAIEEWKKQDPIPTFTLFKRNNPLLFGKNLETAQLCIEQQEYQEALESYAKAFLYTNDWSNYLELPKLFEKISSPEKATLAYLYLALYQLQDGKVSEALQTLEYCKKITPLSQQIDKILIQIYHANKQTDQAIKLALHSARNLALTNPQEAIRLYKQVLNLDPCQWTVYRHLSVLLQNPQEKAHILLKGVCHALDSKEYKTAKELSKEAEKNYEDSFIDRLIDIEFLSQQTPSLLKGKLLALAQMYEKKNLIAPMVKVYKRLTHLDYDPTYYQKILLHTTNAANKTRWTLAWLSAAIKNKDWQSAQSVAQTALKTTQEPIPILCQLETVYTQWHDHELNNLWSQLGSAYLRTGQIDLAERTYRKAYEKFQTLEHALSLGETLLRQDKKEESMQVYYDASVLALLSENLESLDLCLGNIRQNDPILACFASAQKIHVVTQSQIIKLSAELKQTKEELEQLKKQINPAPIQVPVQAPPKAQPVAPVQAPIAPALPAWVCGAAKWKKHIGDPGVEPPLPPEIIQRLGELNANNVLVLIPETVNGRPLDLKTLGELVQKPLQGHATKYSYFNLGKYVDRPASKSHWALLTRTVIDGSRNKLLKDEQVVLNSYSLKTDIPYEAPTILDATVCNFMEYVRFGTWLYGDNPLTYTWCQEKYNANYNLVVGGGSAPGLHVRYYAGAREGNGVGGLRKF
jgi:tetratricopeptide (TPR) repeat protein